MGPILLAHRSNYLFQLFIIFLEVLKQLKKFKLIQFTVKVF